MRAQSVREYLEAVNALFVERGFHSPVDFAGEAGPAYTLYEVVKTWEEEPNRRTHLTPEFIEAVRERASHDKSQNGFSNAINDHIILGRCNGHRLSEYGQQTQQKIDYHELPCGTRRIIKAFLRKDFRFLDNQERTIKDPINNLDLIDTIEITWRVQKNRRNGQRISWKRDHARPHLCPVLAAWRIYSRSVRLGQADDQPMGVYFDRKKVRYITGTKIAKYFKSVAAQVFPDITKTELGAYSAHMIRVSACVILQVADKEADFIKMRLRWESDSYRVYLRNTSLLAKRHLEASTETHIYALTERNLNPLPITVTPQVDPDEVGTYEDFI